MDKRRLFGLLIFVCVGMLAAAGQGRIPVRNFTESDYGAGPQNWAMAQDSVGRVYIANSYGMLTFDGQRWRLLTLSNRTTVRSLWFDGATDRIYAAGSEEFGYFTPIDEYGRISYVSLVPKLPAMHPDFSEIWKIYPMAGKVWFQGDHLLLGYDGQRVTAHPVEGRISCSELIDSRVFIALDNGALLRFNGTSFVTLTGTQMLAGMRIRALLPFEEGRILLVTDVNGLFLYDGQRTIPFDADINPFLKENQAFSAARRGSDFVFGTVDRGAVVKNFRSGTSRYINKEIGMQNNTVLSAGFDRSGNIWLGLDNGLDYAMAESSLTNMLAAANVIGAGYVSMLRGDRLFLGTNQGLYSAAWPMTDSPFPAELRRELKGQVWSMDNIDAELFVAGDAGVFVSSGGTFYRVEGPGGAYAVHELRGNPGQALVSTYNGFWLISNTGGRWNGVRRVKGYDDIGGPFVQDAVGDIWLAHWRKGVYRLHYDRESGMFDRVRLFGHSSGLPSDEGNSIAFWDGRVVLASPGGFFRFNNLHEKFERSKDLERVFSPHHSGTLHSVGDGRLVLMDRNSMKIARKGSDGRLVAEFRPFRTIPGKSIPGFENVNFLSPREVILSNKEGFWILNAEKEGAGAPRPKVFVASVRANMDSIIYQARPDGKVPECFDVAYRLNSLQFEFGYPYYNVAKSVEFATWLEDYDSDWTPYSMAYTREFAQLREGTYTLHVRSRDLVSGVESEESFSFRILPPWYRTVWAWILYIALGCFVIWCGWWLINRRMAHTRIGIERRKEEELTRVRQKAEKEALVKDYEIATLKSEQLEHDVRHKSQQLTNTAMNLVRKNEILMEISDKISAIQEIRELEAASPGVQKKLKQIQTAIKDNISHDDDWQTFTENFDVVYENYTKRLMERHPNLTGADKRLCCYIRMGLTSKEIAPLVNISYKSVEMARYRLRKRMDLPAETSLTDYLTSL